MASLLPSSKVYGIFAVEIMRRKICILLPLLLLLPPESGGVLNLRNKYFQLSDPMSWHDAQTYCRDKFTDLVTIEGEKENDLLINLPRGWDRDWIGLYRNGSSETWKWSRTDEIANFTFWDYDEPKDGQNCAYRSLYNRKWYSDDCTVPHYFMCYNETLVLVKEKKTWEEALNHCRSLEPVDPSQPATAYQNYRYDLATLLTQDDYAFAQEKAQGATTDEVWTGLRYLADQWFWVGGGGDVQYNNIKGCSTQGFCGVLLKTGSTLFNTRDCGESKNFLCYKKL